MSYANPAAYQLFMGCWSARLARSFIRFAGVEGAQHVLDVGCGTGSLSAALLLAGPAIRVVCVDPVPGYVAFAREAVGDPPIHIPGRSGGAGAGRGRRASSA